MTIPPPPQPQQGPFGVPPGRFTPQQPNEPAPRRRELGEDPALARQRRKPWLPWLLVGIGALAVIALVASFIVASFSSTDPVAAPNTNSPIAAPPTGNPSSTLPSATPVQPPAGSTIPITMDVSFPDGLTFVMPSPGDWSSSTSERQPDAVRLDDPQSGAYLEFLETTQQPSTYRDQDLTESFLNRAHQNFTGNAQLAGAPSSIYVSGAGYQLELLAQRVEWPGDSTGALVISRMMPGAASNIQIFVIAENSDLDNTNSRVWQKLKELTFTIP